MAHEPDYLDQRRAELQELYDRVWTPKVEAAQQRRAAMARVARDVAVQASGTILGGAALAGGSVALGWLNADPELRALAGGIAIAISLTLAVLMRAASKPLDTADDGALFDALRALDDMIADRDRRRNGRPEQPSGAESSDED